MHELSVVEGMMRILTRTARENALERIVAVRLKLGRLRGFDGRQIVLCFETLSEGTPAQGARLEIEAVSPRCRCRDCGRNWVAGGFLLACPSCGGGDAEVEGGRELYIESVEGEPSGAKPASEPIHAKRASRRASREAPARSSMEGTAVGGDSRSALSS